MEQPYIHVLSSSKDFSEKELEQLMDILNCHKCVTDPKRGLFYFINKAADEAHTLPKM